MLRQAIITSKTANAIAVANTVIIVANERTYITPCSNVRNTLFPWTENCPSHCWPGQVKQSGTTSEFGPIRSAASCRVEHFSSGVVRRLGTCQIAPNICSLLPWPLQIGKGTEGHELPGKWKVSKQMVGRRLSQEEAKRLLGKLE